MFIIGSILFIKNQFSSAQVPTELLKKSRMKFVWSKEAESAFNRLKTALISALMLG